eukprot:CAMPEP_0197068354 /NCGR_PEP_ID=MMETSP1384-20130603/186132_1 /TAXON_ID=29189 /ORGANISM="Ammonia sp." /LENGTH=147 /DNA_ID=CAMNT_0042506075 /DNA_START=150 /DNA_END=596 /DNA_ORIENTATION=+
MYSSVPTVSNLRYAWADSEHLTSIGNVDPILYDQITTPCIHSHEYCVSNQIGHRLSGAHTNPVRVWGSLAHPFERNEEHPFDLRYIGVIVQRPDSPLEALDPIHSQLVESNDSREAHWHGLHEVDDDLTTAPYAFQSKLDYFVPQMW